MRRVIRFRGKDSLTGEWCHGHYTTARSKDSETGGPMERHIIHSDDGTHEIESETLGQYTGLWDSNGVEIYEGDILRVSDLYVAEVRFSICRWEIYGGRNGVWSMLESDGTTIIGNIHDTPELLVNGA